MDIHLRKRTELLKSLETRSLEMSNAFIIYREAEKAEWPKISADGEIDEKDGELLGEIYHNHRTALEAILDIAGKMKGNIENLQAYFEETPEDKERKEHLAAIMKRREEELGKKNIE